MSDIITTEEVERLAQTHDLVRFTLGMKAPEHDLTSAALRSLVAERDALRSENEKLREALRTAKDLYLHDSTTSAFIEICAALGEKE
jgi:hypothetical protein